MSPSSPSLHTPIVPGAILAGKYRVERIIGQGGMGVVVLARHIALDDRVAMKFLLPEYATHPEASMRFMREAQNTRKIKSEHVVRVTDVGTLESGAPYMVMEFLEGCDLSKTLETTGVLSVPDAIDFIVQGCEAISEAHQHGIVHRDLKPANLFLSRRPDGSPIVKVLDFGISKAAGGAVENLTKTTAAMGSALYMSPEQMQSTRGVDHRTDIYALGVALYELLAGKQPYYAETLPQLVAEILTGEPTPIRTLRPEVPEELGAVIEKAYARDRAQRYQSIADFVVALAPFAPQRTQQTLERVARMAGLPIPIAGVPAGRLPSASNPPTPVSPGMMTAPRQGGTQAMPQYEATPQRASSPGTMPLPAYQGPGPGTGPLPQQPPVAPQPPAAPLPPNPPVAPLPQLFDPHKIEPGHYDGPVSVRAAARFAQGPGQITAGGMASTGRRSGGSSAIGLVIAGLLTIALLGVALMFALRRPSSGAAGPGPEVTTASPRPLPSAEPTEIAPPPETTKVADPPVPSSAASAPEPLKGKLPVGKPLKGALPTATPKPPDDPLAIKKEHK